MSWAFLVDLRLEFRNTDWRALSRKSPRDCPIPAQWPAPSRFGKAFRSERWEALEIPFQKVIFAAEPYWKMLERESLRRVTHWDDRAKVRFAVALDKSLLDGAAVAACLFYGASRIPGATGRLVVVNDGTGPDENGWCFTLSGGKVKREHLEDCWEYSDEISAALWPEASPDGPVSPAVQTIPGKGKGYWGMNPFTKDKVWIPKR